MIRAPVIHDAIDVLEGAFACESRGKPSRRPSLVCALTQRLVDLGGNVSRPAFGNLENRTQPLDQTDPVMVIGMRTRQVAG